jgi:hypothetical protein
VTGLQTALDGKAATSHNHTASQISDSTPAGRAVLTAADATAQRTALGLGSAAEKAIGTSGNTVPVLDAINTWSAAQAFQNSLTLQQVIEKVTLTGSAPASTQNFNVLTQALQYFTANATAAWTLNVRGNGTFSLDSIMAVGQGVTIGVLTTQGSTAYHQSAMTIDGVSVTPKWVEGNAPTSGNTNALDFYIFNIIKTGVATFTVLAQRSKFA